MSERPMWKPMRPEELFSRLQLPFVAGVVFVAATAGLVVPDLWGSVPLLLGVALPLAASVVFALPDRGWLLTPWGIVIPLVDIVALAVLRAPLYPYVPAVGLLSLMPFAWIALRWRWPALVAVFAGGLLIAGLPPLLRGDAISTPLVLLNLLTLPLITTGIAVGIHLAVRSFRTSRQEVEDAASRLTETLAQSRDNEIVLRTVLDTVNGAVAFYGADDRLVLANRVAEKFVDVAGFRLDAPPYSGPNALMADRETPVPPEEQIIPRALRGDVIRNHLEWLGPAGNQIAILASSRRVHRPCGELLGTVIAAYDVTDLADAVDVREELLTTVSHELRTPLTSVVGYAHHIIDILGDDADRLGVANALATIARNGDVLLERVSQLLAAGDRTLVLTPTVADVAGVVRETAEALRPFAHQAGVAMSVDGDDEVVAEIDPRRIAQAVENLLTNAVKFTPRGGSIAVRVDHADDDAVHIAISDTGTGMTAEEKRRVFDRFYRAKSARKNAIQGIGVGLSIVKSIVGAHRGEITVESEPDRGTTITLRLPRVRDSAQPAEEFALSA
jgi:signal transduction histidine kinase